MFGEADEGAELLGVEVDAVPDELGAEGLAEVLVGEEGEGFGVGGVAAAGGLHPLEGTPEPRRTRRTGEGRQATTAPTES